MEEEENDDDDNDLDELNDDASEFEDENIDPNVASFVFSDNKSDISEHDNEDMENFDDIEIWEQENNFKDKPAFYYGRNGFKWSSQQPKHSSSKPSNATPMGAATLVLETNISDKPIQYWSQLFNEHIEDIIIEYTNKKLSLKFRSKSDIETKPLDKFELRAFLGLLIYTSVFKLSRESLNSLFATDGTGRDIFRATMSKLRFLTILSCLRFDNSSDRKERLSNDPVAAISEVFNIFKKNCSKSYSLGAQVCVEEMLVSFAGKCNFKAFMPDKSSKYGIKIMALTDAQTHYVADAYIYYGQGADSSNHTAEETKWVQPSQSVLRLCSTIVGTNRNIIARKKFSSVALVKKLKKCQLTFLGAIGENKKEIPIEFLPNTERPVESYLYGFTQDMTLLSFVPNKKEAVILISSMHQVPASDPKTHKPQILIDYLKAKKQIEILDKQFSIYSSSRRTQRWPLAIFLRLVDIGSFNAHILSLSSGSRRKTSRADFLKALGRNLVTAHLQRREHNKRLPRTLRQAIHMILGADSLPEPIAERPVYYTSAAKLCYICPNKLKRKTKQFCLECKKPMCMGCSKRICINCTLTQVDE